MLELGLRLAAQLLFAPFWIPDSVLRIAPKCLL
jgi:hypothetical protein